MNTWLLIITLVTSGSASIETIEFPSEESCLEAKERYSEATKLSNFYIREICVAR